MLLEISGRHTEVRPATREYIEKKLKKVQKVAHHIESIEVRLSENKNTFEVDIRMNADRGYYTASAQGENARAAVDAAINKLERQVAEKHEKRVGLRDEDSVPEAPQPSDEVEDEYPEEANN
jgi:putative sigma-54 modulation protein